jgi:hypothetical protein
MRRRAAQASAIQWYWSLQGARAFEIDDRVMRGSGAIGILARRRAQPLFSIWVAAQMIDTMQQLLRPGRLWSRAEILEKACPPPMSPGVYAWYFDRLPPTVPKGSYHTFGGRQVLFVGISPKPPSKNGTAPSKQTVLQRLRYHYRGNAAGSTLDCVSCRSRHIF